MCSFKIQWPRFLKNLWVLMTLATNATKGTVVNNQRYVLIICVCACARYQRRDCCLDGYQRRDCGLDAPCPMHLLINFHPSARSQRPMALHPLPALAATSTRCTSRTPQSCPPLNESLWSTEWDTACQNMSCSSKKVSTCRSDGWSTPCVSDVVSVATSNQESSWATMATDHFDISLCFSDFL